LAASEKGRQIECRMSTLALIAGPLVRASSWEPTADVLRDLGFAVVVPEVISSPWEYPAWSSWADRLLALLSRDECLTLVGHSSASVLVAQLAGSMHAEGIVLVDGVVPPSSGAVGPVPDRLLGFLSGLYGPDGVLPPWSDWWDASPLQGAIGIPLLRVNEQAYQTFRQALPRMARVWFDDVAYLNPWRHTPVGYLQLSSLYAGSAAEADQLGWPVVRLNGTHLHPITAPRETASAIAALHARLQSAARVPQ
jgi:hypothetical protein